LVIDFTDIKIGLGDKILIGRYDETRLQYIHDAFRIKVADGYDWRATHMGIDLFTKPGTAVYAPLDGVIHSFADNTGRFDYGPTLILEHNIDKSIFWTLYGHLASIDGFEIGKTINKGEKIAEIGNYEINGNWPPHLHFQLIIDLMGYEGTFPGVVEYRYHDIWKIISPDPNLILKIPNIDSVELGVDDILAFREKHMGKSLSVSYNKPLKIVRGFMQYLYDYTGRQYLDAVNNIPHVGHNHPHVVESLIKQVQVLNTNTRYLHENIIRYTTELLKTMPKPLEVLFFVNSGSEANELAIRLARTYTQRDDIIVLDCGYHGNTNLLIDISPYKFSGPGGAGRKDFVHPVKTPDVFRGEFRGENAGELYAEEIAEVTKNNKIAVFICESLSGVGGQIVLPEGYFEHAFAHVRDAGGLCIADEVQVGFGRIGYYFWGFEQQNVIPDIVVLGKPIGNGHPMAAVVTTQEIADAFNTGMEYFNSFGGNPVSCAVGSAVLEVVHNERLQEHALEVGTYLLNRLSDLKKKYDLIGDVRGMGLYIGLELILDEQLSPAADEANYIINRMRDHGILISTEGPLHNVLKIKPPMQFTIENADFLADTLDQIMQEDHLNL
jgi:4-aminobutyrate aminotransferase-like enzyme